MFFTESWMSPNLPNAMVCTKGYEVLRVDRESRKGGGVLLLHKNHLNVSQINIPSQSETNQYGFELLCVDVFDGKKPIRFCCCYLPPQFSHCQSTVKALCKKIQQLQPSNGPYFVFGDFNLPNILWNVPTSNGDIAHETFLDFCVTNCFTQIINEPTHEKGNILDLLLCNALSFDILLSSVILPPLTLTCDHFCYLLM